mmetsp:Transcript_80781/g.210366  ORF Transcript_80781/g.210366 Transcript_80781/m.210366 type:complete len:154 (+) Transcript_80781:156-617(+)
MTSGERSYWKAERPFLQYWHQYIVKENRFYNDILDDRPSLHRTGRFVAAVPPGGGSVVAAAASMRAARSASSPALGGSGPRTTPALSFGAAGLDEVPRSMYYTTEVQVPTLRPATGAAAPIVRPPTMPPRGFGAVAPHRGTCWDSGENYYFGA